MDELRIVNPTCFDLGYLSLNLREIDRREVRGYTGKDILSALQDSVGLSPICKVALVGEVPVAIYGIAGHPLAAEGVPWMLATDRLYNNLMRFSRETRAFMQYAKRQYSQLSNYVHAENATTIKWLTHLGFTVCDEEQEFYFGERFRKFYWRSDNV